MDDERTLNTGIIRQISVVEERVSPSNKLDEMLNTSCSVPMPLVSNLRLKHITSDVHDWNISCSEVTRDI